MQHFVSNDPKCDVHREYLNVKNHIFFRRKGHLAKSMGYQSFNIDKDGYLENFELIQSELLNVYELSRIFFL